MALGAQPNPLITKQKKKMKHIEMTAHTQEDVRTNEGRKRRTKNK